MKNILFLNVLSLFLVSSAFATAANPVEAVQECMESFSDFAEYAPACAGVKTSADAKVVRDCMKNFQDLAQYSPVCAGVKTISDSKAVRACMKNFRDLAQYVPACAGVTFTAR